VQDGAALVSGANRWVRDLVAKTAGKSLVLVVAKELLTKEQHLVLEQRLIDEIEILR
jgi:hypothetical protein